MLPRGAERVQLAEAANAKLGRAIARAQSSLVAECKSILDSTIVAGPSSAVLQDGEWSV